jgi:site-specific DNA-adenine methylase
MGTAIVSGTFSSRFGANELQPELYDFWSMAWRSFDKLSVELLELMDEKNKNEAFFYERREEYNEMWRANEFGSRRSILYYFLVSACHGSIPRFGKNGFNAPYKLQLGSKKFDIVRRLEAVKTIAGKINYLSNGDANSVLKAWSEVVDHYDIIFADPPYVNGSFVYGENSWSKDDLYELDELLNWYSKRGKLCLMTNYLDHEFIQQSVADEVIHKKNHRKSWRKNFTSEDVLLVYGQRGLDVF